MKYYNPDTKSSGKATIEKLSLLSVPGFVDNVEVLNLEENLQDVLKAHDEQTEEIERLSKGVHNLMTEVEDRGAAIAKRNKAITVLPSVLLTAILLWWYGYLVIGK